MSTIASSGRRRAEQAAPAQLLEATVLDPPEAANGFLRVEVDNQPGVVQECPYARWGGMTPMAGDAAAVEVSDGGTYWALWWPQNGQVPDEGGGGTLLKGEWRWTTGSCGNGQARLDTSSWTTATKVQLAEVTNPGTDATNLLTGITPGDELYLQDKDDASKWGRYTVTGPGVDQGLYREFPVTLLSSAGSVPSNNQITTVIAKLGGGSGGGGVASYSTPIGNGAATSFTITHNLGSRDVGVYAYRTAAPYDQVEIDIERTTPNTVTVRTATPPAVNELTVVVTGAGVTTGPSVGDLSYVHTQLVTSAAWVINHNLGKYPSVEVVNSGGNVVIPDVVWNSTDQVTITLGSPDTGKAYLN
jgi:hypothetical protein